MGYTRLVYPQKPIKHDHCGSGKREKTIWDFGVQYDVVPACLANPDHHVINLSKPLVRSLKIKYIRVYQYISSVCYILIALSQYISISVYRATNHYLEDHRTVRQWFSCATSLSHRRIHESGTCHHQGWTGWTTWPLTIRGMILQS